MKMSTKETAGLILKFFLRQCIEERADIVALFLGKKLINYRLNVDLLRERDRDRGRQREISRET